MIQGRLFSILLVGIFILLIVITHTIIDNKKSKCANLGGIYIEGQCFKADIIKLD